MVKVRDLSRKLFGPVLTPEALLYDKWTIFNKKKLSKIVYQMYLGEGMLGASFPIINLKRKLLISNQTRPKYI